MHVRKPSPGTAIALLALFFAMGGTAIAAHHYLITSTKQIKPSVLKALKGNAGAKGVTGVKGETGLKGEKGEKGNTGEPGPLVATLPSGKTERGAWGFAGTRPATAGYVPGVTTSYPIPLSFTPKLNVIAVSGSPTASCPGSFENPTATAGNLCIYAEREDVKISPEITQAKGHFGFFLFAITESASQQDYEVDGTWAVTAP